MKTVYQQLIRYLRYSVLGWVLTCSGVTGQEQSNTMAGNADPLVPFTGNPDYYQGEADIITRGADTSEIFFTSLLYSDNNGCWGGVFHSTDNGKTIILKHKYYVNCPMPFPFIYGDSAAGTIYLTGYPGPYSRMISNDNGLTFNPLQTNGFGFDQFASGCNQGEFFGGNNYPYHRLIRFSEYGATTQITDSNYTALHLVDVGTNSGELYAMDLNQPGKIFFSNTYGSTFTSYYMNPTVYSEFWSRGTVSGELYIAYEEPLTYSWHIFHSTDYGHMLTLQHITEPPGGCIGYPDYVSFTAGRAPGTFYMIREFTWSLTHMEVWIDYSTDYGQTFTQYCHDLDSTFAVISVYKPASDLVFYPNPASGKITIESPKMPGKLTVEIFDLAGKCRINSSLEPVGEKTDVSVETLPDGVYFIRLHTGETQPAVRKLVVQRK